MVDNRLNSRFSVSVIFGFLLSLLLVVHIFKLSAFILLNHYHSPGMDLFFTYFTYMGDGLFCCAIIIALWISGNRMLSLKMLYGFIISSLLVQILKNLIHAPRPMEILSSHVYNYFIIGITHIGHCSFPSGHTTTTFTIAAIFAFNSSNRFLKTFVFALALGVAYSRIYLAQHFVEDVLAGIILGLLDAKLAEYVYTYFLCKWPENKQLHFILKKQ